MTHRERFIAAATRNNPDRAVFDLYGSHQTLIDSEAVRDNLAALLGVPDKNPADKIEGILRALDIDTRLVGDLIIPKSPHVREEAGVFYDSFGVGRKLINGYYEITHNPLCDCTLEEIQAYPLPDPSLIDMRQIEDFAQRAKWLHNETDYAVIAAHPVLGVFELGCWMFGFDDYLYRILAEPEVVHAFSKRVLEFQLKVIDVYYSALGGYIDCTTSGDDFGTQWSQFMSAETFDEMVAPYFRKRIQRTKKLSKTLYMHHTCGSVHGLIPSLIECGVDILNPIQPGTHMMEPERLKADYGNDLAFWGGIDTQALLRLSTPDEIKDEVKRILGILEPGGGYILAPAHTIQHDVPAENLLAVYQGAHEFYGLRTIF